MRYLTEIIKEDFLSRIISISKKRKNQLYLVGGFLRDSVIDRRREKLDLDFAVDKDAIGLAREFARQTKSGFVVLDKEHGCARVIYKDCTLDFTDFRGKDLKDDLLHRDFTINTLALKLPAGKDLKKSLIDYHGALDDLKKGLIKITSHKSFEEDYLRILRVFSLSAIFKFQIEKKTMSLAKKSKDKLLDVAGERMRDELFKILDTSETTKYIKLLDETRILSRIIPQIELMRSIKQGPYHHLDVWEHSLETLRQLEILFIELKQDKELNSYLDEKIGGERKRRQLIKLVCILHDIGKPKALEVKEGKTRFHGHERIGRDIADAISERLKLSTKEKFAIDTMIFWHLRPGYLADNKNVTERAKFRYFRDAGSEALSILLLSISDQRATRGPLASLESRRKHEKVAFELIKEYFRRQKEKKFVRLINGDDLIKKLKLAPSPLFKNILQEIEESQAEGKVKTKQQALDLAKKIAGKGNKK
ncbi:MAG: HD domain-containing protein [Candidatus Omnitrophica bacterium]|nr:HD domain-containing protein [Candidatus Omnitrophota bacterium]MDD5352898.1 HD domain-containing protein [Candidatus Omnitrophota bacterium]MDD5550497.1 HD domain-containing protein [Candidatus Omnitrophota bacterium]